MAETLTLVHQATGRTQTISNEKGLSAWFLIFRYWFAPMLMIGNYLLGLTGILLIAAVIYFTVVTDDNKALGGWALIAYVVIGAYVSFKRTDLIVKSLQKRGWTLKDAAPSQEA